MAPRRGTVHVGTSGWTYDHWLGRFYPAKPVRRSARESRLRQYARTFRSVEINASFYRMPTPAAMTAWLAETPDDFVFTAKTSRFITHRKRLLEPEVHIPIFYGRISALARWGLDAFVYFDNDEKAYAAEDARRLQDLLA